MANINVEMNVKTSSGYDQLYPKTNGSQVDYTTDRTGASSVTTVELALNYLMNGNFISLNGEDVLSYFVNNQKDNSTIVVRGINNPNPPTGQSTSNNDLYYISFKQSNLYITVLTIDARTNGFYLINLNNGVWGSWKNGSNADFLGGVSRIGFMQNYPSGTGIDVNDSRFNQAYVADIDGAKAITIGLPDNWWHLMFLPHMNNNGFGCQIAFPLDSTTQKPKYRIAMSAVWQDWKSLGGGGATISSSAPSDTEALWIDNNGLMRYHNGSAWTPVKTNAVWG